ncbi:MAG: quinolinate synthase NadA [Bacteroidales bacterium]|nr:quinolinate synthase NadA [Bacteroidales bacterium]
MIPFVDKEKISEKIRKLLKDKNAVLLAHYYQNPEIQEIADFVGDSLVLAQKAVETDAKIIVLAGVYFMAETAKILNPSRKVLIPDPEAGCSLADSCPVDDFIAFKKRYPGHTVISYVNTSAEIKKETDIICTSSNALSIVNSLPKEEKIIFAPDRNLGNYIKRLTGRENMVIWDGACHVHEEFSLEKILELKKLHPEAKILAHPECKKPILIAADYIGSTKALLDFSQKDESSVYIVATESGILYQMKKASPHKTFIPAPPIDSSCGCNDCRFMKMITLEKILTSLEEEKYAIEIDEKIRAAAEIPIRRMLDISSRSGLIR